jgi:hypothetical protein
VYIGFSFINHFAFAPRHFYTLGITIHFLLFDIHAPPLSMCRCYHYNFLNTTAWPYSRQQPLPFHNTHVLSFKAYTWPLFYYIFPVTFLFWPAKTFLSLKPSSSSGADHHYTSRNLHCPSVRLQPAYSSVPEGLLNHCEGISSTFPKLGTKFDAHSLFHSLIHREYHHRSRTRLDINTCENCSRPPCYVQLGTLTH